MFVLQNAWKNIGRNKGRNILMGVIILAIIAASSIALIINNTAGGIIDNYKERFSSEVSIMPNMQKVQEEAMRNAPSDGGGRGMIRIMRPEISPEQYIRFGESEYVKEAKYSSSVGVFKSGGLDFVDEDKGGGGRRMMMRIGPGGGGEAPDEEQFFANLLGYNYVPEDFANGDRQLAEGNFPENDNECVVSRDLFEKNGLSLGDTLILTSEIRDAELRLPDEEDESEVVSISYTLKVVGYYDDLTSEYNNEYMQNAYTNRRNEILTTVNTVIEPMREGFTGIEVNARYYLQNPADLDKFAAELYAKGLDEKFDVATDQAGYDTITKPVEGLKGITYVFLAAVLILGAVILLLLSTIAIRERKYEVGVLRAMGMKKGKVALGLLSEVVTVTAVCLILGLVVGIMVAQPVSDMLLEGQLRQIEEQGQDNNMMAYGPGGMTRMNTAGAMRIGGPMGGSMTPAEALKKMDVSLSLLTIGEIIAVSLLLAVAASMAGIMHITKYEPIKILSDRN